MPPLQRDALKLMVANGRYGQKNGIGFYRYETTAGGKPQKLAAPETYSLLAAIQPGGPKEFSDADIIDRMMLSLMVEAAHALEEGVVATAAELDMALLLGIGFPRHLGGPMKYADWLGMAEVVRRCDRLAHLGRQYQATDAMRRMAASGGAYYEGERVG
jgi:3-hydroxyacyl-CoA dehydrogenase/enoyl-CoA hydratase/3-hydroxybutyryl-CoA epimerase/enoyl-CoA isomerase